MNKAELIDAIAQNADVSKAAASRALDAYIETITQVLTSGETVSLVGFGSFQVKTSAERVGRNPSSGKPITIAAARKPSFKAGKGLKDSVN